jgi:hypothetical protein
MDAKEGDNESGEERESVCCVMCIESLKEDEGGNDGT